jgi:hypothetical protein
VWELVRSSVEDDIRSLEDDERAATAFLWLGGAGIVTWFMVAALADDLVPTTSVASLLSVVFGVVGWRAARQGVPREATTMVGIVLAVILAFVWLYLVLSLVFKLV